MKNMKKLISVLLTLVMALALTVPAFAAPTNTTITAPAGSTRTYDVYQIFVGDLSGKVLSNVKWGENGTGTKGVPVDKTTLDALVSVNSKSDTEKLDEIEKYVSLTSTAFGTVDKDTSLTVPTGYYLIKDKGPVGDKESYSLFVVQVVGPTTISPKVGTTTSEKKVKDTNDSTGDTSDWQDFADYDIGDNVPFQLKATLPDNVSVYDTYKVVFHDTLSKGLTYNGDAKVYIGGTETNGFTVTTGTDKDDNPTLIISCDNVKALNAGNGSVITVEYTAKLNENAVVGSTGNSNKMHLEYSNNPNNSGAGNNETGNTPEDTVVVFTYKTIINKVTKNPDYNPGVEGSQEYIPLTGAAFKLEKKGSTGAWTTVKEFTVDSTATSFEFSGLDDGTYKLTETVTPAGYNTIDPIEFTITAAHDDSSAAPTLTSLSGNATVGEINFTPNTTAGSLTADVVNQAGAVLPETGGMGTTLFYILGSVLVLGAGVLLVVKKRMGADK